MLEGSALLPLDLGNNPCHRHESATSEEEALPFNGIGFPTMHLQAAPPDMGA